MQELITLVIGNINGSKYVFFKIFYVYALAKLNYTPNFSSRRSKIMPIAFMILGK